MNPSEKYWLTRLESCAKALTKNGFSAIVVDRIEDAANAAAEIIEKLAPRTIGYADSRTMHRSGILNVIRQDDRRTLIDGFDPSKERAENLLTRRQALLSDLFLTGANAVTEKGELVWLDMLGNRIAAVAFGPEHVLLFIGRNKLTPDLESARQRIKTLAAPMNALAHATFKTPCRTTARCHDCNSPDRICNGWLILEKCFPKERIAVILINEDLGY